MSLLDLQPVFSILWVVWFFVLFMFVITYVMAPRRRRGYDHAGDIPLRDEQPAARPGQRRDSLDAD